MKKRILSIALVLCMMLSVMPTAFATGENATVYIAGKVITTSGDYSNTGESVTENGTVNVNFESHTITLNCATISATVDSNGINAVNMEGVNGSFGIFINDQTEWNMVLQGENTLTFKNEYASSIIACGIFASGGLSISGEVNAKLTVTAESVSTNPFTLYGIFTSNVLSLKNCGLSVTLNANNVSRTNYGAAIGTTGNMSIENATVSAASTGRGDEGIHAQGSMTITGEETTVTVATESAEGASSTPSGIVCDDKLTINGGNVDVDTPKGIHGSELTISDNATVHVDAAEYGISGGTINVSSPNVTVVVTGSEGNAIQAITESVNISAGTYKGNVEATKSATIAGTAAITGDISCVGVIGKNATVTINGGSVSGTVTSGASSTVEVTGGSVGAISTGTDSAVAVSGETTQITGNITMAGTSESAEAPASLTISGGTVGGSVSAGAGATTVISGENTVITGDVTTSEGGTTAISSGTIGGNVETAEGAETTITGGILTNDTDAPVADGYYRDPETGEVKEGSTPLPPSPPSYDDSEPTYSIANEDTDNGSVKLNKKYAEAGETVTLTVTPDDGYELKSLTVTDRNGNEIKLTDKGDGTYTFKMPSGKVTVEATFVEAVTENPFVDVDKDAYYYDAVLWAAENGITGGTSATTFSPAAACTRAQTVTFLWRAAGSPEPKTAVSPFEDVDPSAYYYKAVLWAAEQGITGGTSATTFSPDATVTRSQNVTFLWRMAGSPAAEQTTSFGDVASDTYYHDAVVWAADEAITSGTSATTFSPTDPCLRSQIVTFLYRYYVD